MVQIICVIVISLCLGFSCFMLGKSHELDIQNKEKKELIEQNDKQIKANDILIKEYDKKPKQG